MDKYDNPLCKRYASDQIQYIFSDKMKFTTWRKLWVALAESEMELGLPITNAQIEEMRIHIEDINYDIAEQFERVTKHDVMAHIYAYGEQCPQAKSIIHLGATSCYIRDNTDIIQMRLGMQHIRRLLLNTIAALSDYSSKYSSQPSLSYTHLQPAQPTTVGKRSTLWISDLLLDLQQMDFQLDTLKLLGCKGATGTSASFLSLFDGNFQKVKELEKKYCRKDGFSSNFFDKRTDLS